MYHNATRDVSLDRWHDDVKRLQDVRKLPGIAIALHCRTRYTMMVLCGFHNYR